MLTALWLLAASQTLAEDFDQACPTLEACAKAVSALLHQHYLFEPDALAKAKTASTPGLALNPENAELLFTQALHVAGFTRVPTKPAGTFQILTLEKARASASLPVLRASHQLPARPRPELWDLATLEYQARPGTALAAMSQALPGATLDAPTRTLRVTDTGPGLQAVYERLRALDMPGTAPKPTAKRP